MKLSFMAGVVTWCKQEILIAPNFEHTWEKGGVKKVSRTPRLNDYPSNELLEKFGWQEGEEERNAFSQDFGYATEAISAETGTSSPSCNKKQPKPNKGKGKGKGKK
jgi:hypothetical protein